MLHISAMQRGKCFNRRHRRRLPQSLPPFSVYVCACVFVCRTHVNDVLIVACPLRVTFGFVSDLCGMCPSLHTPFLYHCPLSAAITACHCLWHRAHFA